MGYRVLEVTLLSAKDLKKVNLISRMDVYAVVTISGDPITRQCTAPDPYGGRHPTWNATLRFTVPPTAASASGCLHVLLRTERSRGDRDVGEVIVPLAEILAGAGARDLGPRPPQFASYQVRKVHRTETHGVLNMSYRLGHVISPQPQVPLAQARFDEPVVAYPAARPLHHPQTYNYLPQAMQLPPPHPQASGHMAMLPPPPQGSGHTMPPPPPSPQGYGRVPMAPPQQDAGYLPMVPFQQTAGHVAPPPKPVGHVAASPMAAKSSAKELDFGMGLSAGLVGGAIGGMMAGDMMSDAAAYNAGYRAGLAAEWGGPVY